MADYKNINIRNKRATFDYEIIEEWIAGIVLVGTEIKSVRLGKASITDSYCYFDKGELWIRGVNIAEYGWGTCNNHVPRRDRKLLLTKKELRKIDSAARNSGFTIIPTRMFINEKGLAKVVVAIAKGKKEYDKRDSIKARDDKREMDRAFKRDEIFVPFLFTLGIGRKTPFQNITDPLFRAMLPIHKTSLYHRISPPIRLYCNKPFVPPKSNPLSHDKLF